MAMIHCVYHLIDPETGEVLYVGRSYQPQVRQRAFEKRNERQTILLVHQKFDEFNEACSAELKEISKYKPPFNLSVQSSSGNYGHTGKHISEWHKQQIILGSKGRKRSLETGKRISAALMGKKLSLEHRKKIVAATTGRKQSPETVAKRKATIMQRYGGYVYSKKVKGN